MPDPTDRTAGAEKAPSSRLPATTPAPADGDSHAKLPAGITAEDADRITRYLEKGKRASTRRVYRSKWRLFVQWCDGRGIDPHPCTPGDVVTYLTYRADQVSLSTVRQDAAAIAWMHKRYGEPDPTTADVVTQALEGIAEKEREDGQAPEPKRALFTKHVRAMVEAVQAPEPGADAGRVEWNRFHRGRRDAALLLVGFAGAMRRAELAAIEAGDVSFNDAGMEVHLPKTKTEARTVGINRGRNPDFCPVRALREWLDVSGIESGPVFRAVPRTAEMKADDEAEPMTGQSIRNVIGRAADAVDGLDRDDVAGHSLRRGHITQAAQNGASLERLMKQAGHVDPRTTTRYVEDANRMETNTSRDLGL